MPLHYRIDHNSIVILGNTFAFKERLKSLGAIFDSQRKVWVLGFDANSQELISALCRATGGGLIPSSTLAEDHSSLKNPDTRIENLSPSPEGVPERKVLSQGKRFEISGNGQQELNGDRKSYFDAKPTSTQNAQESGTDRVSSSEQEKTWTVSEFLDYVARIVEQNVPGSLWLVGEIQNLNFRSQAAFFSFSEEKPVTAFTTKGSLTIPVTLWSKQVQVLRRKYGKDFDLLLKDGQKIRALVTPNFYRDRAQISLNVLDIDLAYTKGALALKREALVKELKQKNLYDKNRSLALPRLIMRIGLITAKGSRAYTDFIDQLISTDTHLTIDFFSAPMQGEAAAKVICAGIKKLSSLKPDLIVITRGGGSGADLAWFNEAEIAYAIAGASVPILSAIGHHDDTSVAEEVSYHREKTPTAAGEYLAKNQGNFRNQLRSWTLFFSKYLERSYHRALDKKSKRLENLKMVSSHYLEQRKYGVHKLKFRLSDRTFHKISLGTIGLTKLLASLGRNIEAYFAQKQEVLRIRQNRLGTSTSNMVQKRHDILQNLQLKLSRLDPHIWLSKGWTELRGPMGEKVLSVSQVGKGDKLQAVLQDGSLSLEVIGKKYLARSNSKGDQNNV